MKSFLEHIKEEVLPSVQVTDGGLDISKPAVRAAINAAIAGVVSQPAVTPYVVFNRLSKLLAQYHIVLPKKFLEGDKGVEVFEIKQFGHKMGMTDSGEFVTEVPATHYLFLQYGIITPFGVTYAKPIVGGMFRVSARLVDKEELDKLLDMAEITMAEEAECMQAIAKANAPKDEMHDVTSDPKKVGNKKAVATSEKKSLDEERKRTSSVADAFLKGEKANQRTLRSHGTHVTYHGNTIASHKGDHVHITTAGYGHSPSTRGHINGILDRLGSPRLSVKKGQLHHGDKPIDSDHVIKVRKPSGQTVSEDKGPCWKGYEMVGMKKKGGRKVPNCVPTNEESLDEISQELADRYKSKSLGDSLKAKSQKEKALGRYAARYIVGTRFDDTMKKREKGLKLANKKYPSKEKTWAKFDEETLDEVSLAKAAKTARQRNIGAERDAHASPYDYSPHIDVLKGKAYKTLDRIERKHGEDKAKKIARKMNKDTDDVWRGKFDEGRMPASVIAHKQKLANMSDEEFSKKYGHKSEKDLRDMAARHGYGWNKEAKTGSDHYVKRLSSLQKEEKGDKLTPGFSNRKDFDTIAKEIGTGKGGMTIVDKAPKGGESSSQTIYPMSPKSGSRVAPDDVEKKLDQTTPGNPQAERNRDLHEKLTKKMPASDVISDFVHSKAKTFKGDTKKKRISRALGAYYGMHPEKSKK